MTIVYTQNRIPQRTLENVASAKAFTGKNPSVEHL